MFNLNLKNKANKHHLWVGAGLAVLATALLPAEYNPAVWVNSMIEKMKSKS